MTFEAQQPQAEAPGRGLGIRGRALATGGRVVSEVASLVWPKHQWHQHQDVQLRIMQAAPAAAA